MKQFRLLILLSALSLLVPQTVRAVEMTEVNDEISTELVKEISVVVTDSKLRIQNAEGLTVAIYNITGVKVATFKIDSEDKTVALNLEKGCYIVKVGKVARKIALR